MAKEWSAGWVERLPFTESGQVFHKCPLMPGLLLIIGRQSKTFSYQRDLYVGPRGARRFVQTVRVALRDEDGSRIVDPRKAMVRAGAVRDLIDRGVHPLTNEAPAGERPPTLGEAWRAYAAHLRRQNRAAGTIENHNGYLWERVKHLDKRPLPEVTTQVVTQLHQQLTDEGHPVLANAVAVAVQTVYGLAMLTCAGLPPNPVHRGMRRTIFNEIAPRSRILRPEDFPSFWAKTGRLTPVMRDYWRVVLLTGARRRTLARLLRSNVDLEARTARFERDKTGPYTVPLSDELVAILKGRLRRGAGPYVFPSKHDDELPLQDPTRHELGVSPHDLRRTYKTVLCVDREVSVAHERVLMNHTLRGIDGVYQNRAEIARSPKLREVQQRISSYAMELAKVKRTAR